MITPTTRLNASEMNTTNTYNNEHDATSVTSATITIEEATTTIETTATATTITAGTATNTTATTSAATTAMSKNKTSNPCSNDNPEWEEETLPCLNSHVLEGAVASDDDDAATDGDDATATGTITEATLATTEEAFTIHIQDLPSVYSCNQSNRTKESNQEKINATTKSNFDTNSTESIYLRFNYEMYTIPNQTEDEIIDILYGFERQLGYGVASALGLVDCTKDEEDVDSTGDDTRVRRLRRRSLQNRMLEQELESVANHRFEEVSIEPLDMVDTTLCKSLS